jgi:RHS repeat-associated protein
VRCWDPGASPREPFDLDIGLLFLGRRAFDPTVARFISPDRTVASLYAIDSWNPYCYGRGNPLRNADPGGRFTVGDFFAILAVAVAVAALVVAGWFTGGAAWTLAVPLSMAAATFWGAAIGMAAGAILGGVAAGKAGGDIWAGVLLGGFIGGVTGAMGGGMGSAIFTGIAAKSSVGVFFSYVLSGAVSGAISGAGTGAAIGWAGGKGSAEKFWESLGKGALIGFVTGALVGAAGNFLDGGKQGINVGLDNFDPHPPGAGPVAATARQWNNVVGTGIDAVKSPLHGIPSVLAIGAERGALTWCRISLFQAHAYLNALTVAGSTVTVGADASNALRFGNLLFIGLEAVPYVGWVIAALDAGGVLDGVKNPTRDFFAMPAL